jgi:hypothetical protein
VDQYLKKGVSKELQRRIAMRMIKSKKLQIRFNG